LLLWDKRREDVISAFSAPKGTGAQIIALENEIAGCNHDRKIEEAARARLSDLDTDARLRQITA